MISIQKLLGKRLDLKVMKSFMMVQMMIILLQLLMEKFLQLKSKCRSYNNPFIFKDIVSYNKIGVKMKKYFLVTLICLFTVVVFGIVQDLYVNGDIGPYYTCLLYTSDAADDTPCVDLGGRRIIKKKKKPKTHHQDRHEGTITVAAVNSSNSDASTILYA
eukprot:TRINITY_DN10862_c0_g1_i1.p1 TRINITY_DN10862_c0_g1~~TRINITY_DN10862_c0_g1_i1.p1  ORF type:complete len:160 (-),score=1.30 TRINITY_DN10862_c0_g1_i1:10-489(-)